MSALLEKSMPVSSAPLSVQTPKKASRLYRPELDAIRFFLFLGVLFHHSVNGAGPSHLDASPLLSAVGKMIYGASGFALPFFFFLSSYLITSLLQIEKKRTGSLDLKRFYMRRMLRLWPLYVGYLLLICALHFVLPDFPITWGAIASLLLFSGNWYWIVQGGFPGLVLIHLWSISVEEQFYVLFPFLAGRSSPRRLQQGCVALCAASLAFTWWLVWHGAPATHVWSNSIVQSIFFASGALFALRSTLEPHQKSAPRAALGIGGALVLWLVAQAGGVTVSTSTLHPTSAMLSFAVADIGCFLLLWGTLQVSTTFLPRSLVYLGRIAYGLYVFHMLVIYLVRQFIMPHVSLQGSAMFIELALTIVLASLSYEFVEKPFLRLKHRFELVHSRIA